MNSKFLKIITSISLIGLMLFAGGCASTSHPTAGPNSGSQMSNANKYALATGITTAIASAVIANNTGDKDVDFGDVAIPTAIFTTGAWALGNKKDQDQKLYAIQQQNAQMRHELEMLKKQGTSTSTGKKVVYVREVPEEKDEPLILKKRASREIMLPNGDYAVEQNVYETHVYGDMINVNNNGGGYRQKQPYCGYSGRQRSMSVPKTWSISL